MCVGILCTVNTCKMLDIAADARDKCIARVNTSALKKRKTWLDMRKAPSYL